MTRFQAGAIVFLAIAASAVTFFAGMEYGDSPPRGHVAGCDGDVGPVRDGVLPHGSCCGASGALRGAPVSIATDPHALLTAQEARDRGCTCEFGCQACGAHESQMGNCPAWDPCPMGREPNASCPLTGEPS